MQESNNKLKKIAIMGSGAIGMELLSTLHVQYPNTDIVVWNRESGSGTASAMGGDTAKIIKNKMRAFKDSRTTKIVYTTDMDEAMRGADVVFVTGGIPREDNRQERFELAEKNIPFIDPIAKKAGELARERPNHHVNYIIGTNPIGLIDKYFQEVSGIPHNKIIGLSGELDAARLEQSICLNLKVGSEQIRGVRVVGSHDKYMVPTFSQIEVQQKDGGWKKLLDIPEVMANDAALLKELKHATINGGGKFTVWTAKGDKKGTTDHRAPAAALAYMFEQIAYARWGNADESLPVTASTYLAEKGIYSGQTIAFNKDGAYSPVQTPPLSDFEKDALELSIKNSQNEDKQFRQAADRYKRLSTQRQGQHMGGGGAHR